MNRLSSSRARPAFDYHASAVAGVAILSVGLATWMLIGVAFPDRVTAGLAGGAEARAGAVLSSQPLTPEDLAVADDRSRAALAFSPMNGWSWLRLAYIDRATHGTLTGAGLKHLQASYDVAPYGPQVSSWRITFALDNWASLPAPLKREVLSEIAVSWPVRGTTIDAAVANSRSTSGRIAARVVIQRLKLDAARRWTSATP